DTGYIANVPKSVTGGPGPSPYTMHSIHKTLDGGKNWEKLPVDRFDYVAFISNTTGYYCYYGERDINLFRTTNGGISWSLHNEIEVYIHDMVFINDSIFYAHVYPLGGWRPNIYRSVNEGKNWEPEYSTSEKIFRLYFSGKSVFALCENGTIYKKTLLPVEDSVKYTIRDSIDENSGQQEEFHFSIHQDTLVIYGNIYANSCGGHYLTYKIDSNIIDISRVDTGLLCTGHSLYGFELKIPNCSLNEYRIKMDKYYNKGLDSLINTEVTAFSNKAQLAEKLSVELYPNPVSNIINITLNKPVNSLTYKLLNTSGILVKENEIKHQTNVIQVNVSGIAQGIYFLELICNEKVNTFKVFIEN
ncbi:T9SS type A sorting domain-containing protein, partial [Bacteroidota bacterium]